MAMEVSDIITLVSSGVAVVVSGASMLIKRTQTDVKTQAALDSHHQRITKVEMATKELSDKVDSGFAKLYDKLDTLSNQMHANNTAVLGKLLDHMSQSSK